MDISDHTLEPLRVESDAVLHRGRSGRDGGSILVLIPAPSCQDAAERMERELALAPVLQEIGAVRPLAISCLSGRQVLVLEDPGGYPLRCGDKYERDLQLSLQTAVSVAAALAQLHRRQLVHRDIRPGNILVDEFGNARLTGFGNAARLPLKPATIEEPIVGTLAYMSPEQTGRMDRQVDQRSDLYSLGVTLYEMLAGSLPFMASDAIGLIHSHMAQRPIALSDHLEGIPSQVESIVLKLMAKAPEDRYQTAKSSEQDLRRCLEALEAGRPVESFALGRHDLPNRLQVTKALYGREHELGTLFAAFEGVGSNGKVTVAMVSGRAGTGKSSLLHAVQGQVSLKGGLSVAGKFDQLKRHAPYATIAQSFGSLIANLLGKPRLELEEWRTRLVEALGTNGQLMINLIPQLALIIGEQRPVADVSPLSRQAHFQSVIRGFINVFARPEHPLVWILDDLQWSDSATLDLIEALVHDAGTKNLLLAGAYRDEEVGPSHQLWKTLDRVRGSEASTTEIVLAPLEVGSMQQMVAHAFGANVDDVQGLAGLVFQRTQGNPFFAIQFLMMLAEDGLASFDAYRQRWTWDLARLRDHEPGSNVADLIGAKLGRVSEIGVELLSLIACLGRSADVSVLAVISGRKKNACHAVMRAAVRAGLISRDGNSYFFVHDSVQEAVYALIPEREQASSHLRVGRALQSIAPATPSAECLFDIVDQLNRGRALIHDEVELGQLAYLNLLAARRAKESAAYDAAMSYVAVANQALKNVDAAPHQALTLQLYLLDAECLFLTGALDAAEDMLSRSESLCNTKVDKAAVACLAIELCVVRSENSRAVDRALQCLALFNIDLPKDPSTGDFDAAFDRLWRQFDGRAIETLVHLPRAADEDIEAAMRVLTALFAPAAFYNARLLHLNLCFMVELTLQYGVMEASPAGLGWFGMVLGHVRGLYQEGYRVARVAADIVDLHHFVANEAKTLLALEVASAWVRPIPELLQTIRKSFEVALSSGDLATACFCCPHIVTDMLVQGGSLTDVQEEVDRGLFFTRKAGFRDVVDCLVGQQMFIRNMRGETASFSTFDSADFNTAAFEESLTPGRMLMMIFFYWVMKGSARFMSGDVAEALACFARASPLLPSTSGHFQLLGYHYFSALTLLSPVDGRADPEYRVEEVASHLEQLKRWADACPTTFSDKVALVSAEIARVEGRVLDAMQLFEQAIRLANRHGLVHNEGIGNELAGNFYLKLGFESIAAMHLVNAGQCYRAWGAQGKVRHLREQFPSLLAGVGRPEAVDGVGTSLERLDRGTIVRISQSISSEIDLDKLTESLMRIALEHSGGERALFVQEESDGFWTEAEGIATGGAIRIELRRALIGESALPVSIVRYVLRSRRMVILSDVTGQNPYSDDIYFKLAKCRSLICVPLIRYQEATGVIYIESRSLTNAFGGEVNGVLGLLSSQAAISLENARLYRDRERMTLSARQAESELRLTMNLAPVLVWSVYSNGLGAEFNDRWHEYTGMSPEAARIGGWLETFHPDDRGKVATKWTSLIETGMAGEVEARLLRHDGTSRSFLVRATPLRDGDGNVVKWYGTHTDIDDIRRAEQAQEALARGSRLTTIGELTVSIAHEINQPLMAIVTNAATCLQWLRDDRINIPEARRAAERINADGHRAGEIVASIRSLARKSQPVMARLDLNQAISDVLVLMRGELQRRSIEAEADLDERAAFAIGDRVQIQQVVLNLLMNGVEAIDSAKSARRAVQIRTFRGEPGYTQICVSDSGPGLDAENIEKVFDAFHTTKPDGIGIGLSICRSIVEAHRGRLWAVPERSDGSEFRFTIPAAHDER